MSLLLKALIILIISIIISSISYFFLGVKGPWGSFWIKTLVLFLFLQAINLWIKPVGPEWQGVQYITLIISALLFIIFAASATQLTEQPPKISTKWSTFEKRRFLRQYYNEQKRLVFSMSILFWLLLILLIFLILTGYYFKLS